MDTHVQSEICAFFKSQGLVLEAVDAHYIDQGWVEARDDQEFKGGFFIERHSFGFIAGVNNWRGKDGPKVKRFGSKRLGKADRELLERRRDEFKEQTDQQYLIVKERVCVALLSWQKSDPYRASEYLIRKNLSLTSATSAFERPGLNDNQTVLCVPMMDENYFYWNVQQIWKDKKAFWPGGRTKGLFHKIIGSDYTKVYLGEGFATCFAAHEATGATVWAALSCKNLESVLVVMLTRLLPQDIVLLVDWDVPHQTGLAECLRLSDKYGVNLALPYPFGSVEQEISVDCADVWATYPEDLKRALREIIHTNHAGKYALRSYVAEVANA